MKYVSSFLNLKALKNSRYYFFLFLKGYRYPVSVRFNTSDLDVFREIFIDQVYSCLEHIENPKLIIDLGAYVGYSSLYFLNKYPKAYVICLEPEVENFTACQNNLKHFKERTWLIYSGVWNKKTGLIVCKDRYEDGRQWATQVRECREGEKPDISATDIYSLLSNCGFDSIDILKINIERAELDIFSRNFKQWLDRTKNIIIELHDKECEEVFFRAMSGYKYNLSRAGVFTVCKNISG